MTDPTRTLADLARQWRTTATQMLNAGDLGAGRVAPTLDRCADELEQALAGEQSEADLMRADLYAIGQALGIPAKPYSGHDAVVRDFLPRINALAALVPPQEQDSVWRW